MSVRWLKNTLGELIVVVGILVIFYGFNQLQLPMNLSKDPHQTLRLVTSETLQLTTQASTQSTPTSSDSSMYSTEGPVESNAGQQKVIALYIGTVDINSAGASELETLKGIGPVLAQRIIEDRTLNGPYSDLDALIRVKGIGPVVLEKIKASQGHGQ